MDGTLTRFKDLDQCVIRDLVMRSRTVLLSFFQVSEFSKVKNIFLIILYSNGEISDPTKYIYSRSASLDESKLL